MPENEKEVAKIELAIDEIKDALKQASPDRRQRIFEAIALAALSSIPWIGGVFAAGWTYKMRENEIIHDDLVERWLQEHTDKLRLLREALEAVVDRLGNLGDEIDARIESPDYLGLLRKAFRQWDNADTEEKRQLVIKLITNAAGTRMVSDDVLRLFLDWIDRYHEVHFAHNRSNDLRTAKGSSDSLRYLFFTLRRTKNATRRFGGSGSFPPLDI